MSQSTHGSVLCWWSSQILCVLVEKCQEEVSKKIEMGWKKITFCNWHGCKCFFCISFTLCYDSKVDTIVIPILYIGRLRPLQGRETWPRSRTAGKWLGQDSNPGGLGPESILAALCLVKASKLTLFQPALPFQPKPRGSLDTQGLKSSSGRSLLIPSLSSWGHRGAEGEGLISQWSVVTKLGFTSDPWSIGAIDNNW